MNAHKLLLPLTLALLLTASAFGYLRLAGPGIDMTTAAGAFLAMLTDQQRGTAQMDYATPQRSQMAFHSAGRAKGTANQGDESAPSVLRPWLCCAPL